MSRSVLASPALQGGGHVGAPALQGARICAASSRGQTRSAASAFQQQAPSASGRRTRAASGGARSPGAARHRYASGALGGREALQGRAHRHLATDPRQPPRCGSSSRSPGRKRLLTVIHWAQRGVHAKVLRSAPVFQVVGVGASLHRAIVVQATPPDSCHQAVRAPSAVVSGAPGRGLMLWKGVDRQAPVQAGQRWMFCSSAGLPDPVRLRCRCAVAWG